MKIVEKTDSIAVFDSGLGGISVLNECRRLLPQENYIYYADVENAPYGNYPPEVIDRLTVAAVREILKRPVKALVMACNTATAAGIRHVRELLPIIVVGIEPAVKPAAEEIKDGKILLLCTEATARQEKLAALLARYPDAAVTVAPQRTLAALIETHIDDLSAIRGEVERILAPHLKGLKGVVLGCTHYWFIRETISEICGKDVKIYDGNEGLAKNLKRRLEERDLLRPPARERGQTELLPPLSLPPSYWRLL